MILFWHKTKEGEESRALLERALLAYCAETGKRKPRKKNRSVAEGGHGKPYFPLLPSVFCSVSHSAGYWVCLFDKHPCGVDIEGARCDRTSTAVIRRKFTEEEQKLYEAAPSGDTFLRIWTAKEAYVKYTGEGLARDTLSYSVAENETFRTEMASSYGEPCVILQEIDFRSAELPLIGSAVGTWSEIRILPLPERSAEESRNEAREIALDYVETRERTEKEVREKLREKGVSTEDADEAVSYLKEYRFIDDASYAKRYAEMGAGKGRGPVRISRELIQKGIDRGIVKETLASLAEEQIDFHESAAETARAVYENAGSPELDDRLSAKILRKLASRGFSASDSYEALAELKRSVREHG